MKFKSDIEVQAGIRDSSGAIGTSGQVLSSTGSNVSWINQTTVASDVQNLVKAGVAINKGQAVYVTGADGTNIIVGLASNTSEATSSKTLGLLNATVAVNGFADVVQIGRLAGLNTIGAVAGDPVWLGTNGNLIYGLINKPYAPAHLVFLGIVTRVNANNGEIFVNVQNGFELKEIHDVDIITNVPINGDILGYDGTLWVNKTIAEWLGYTPANASGTTNYVSKFTGATTLGDSQIFDNGTFVGIGTNAPNATLQVGNGTGVKAIYVTGSGNNLGLGGLSVSFLGFATGTISTVNTSGAVPLGVGTRSTQPLILGTNNAERMRIDSSGNVGIGTTDIDSRFKAELINVASLRVAYNGTSVNYYDANENIFRNGSGSERMRITSNGNVGIGTTSPGQKLDVIGNIQGSGFVGSGTGINQSFLQNGNIGFYNAAASPKYIQLTDDSSTINAIGFSKSGSASTTYFPSGNVGIGTTNPGSKLSVIQDNGVITQFNTNATSSENLAIELGAYSTTYPNSGTHIRAYFNHGLTANSDLAFEVNGQQEKMRITSSGNVGIGTISPASLLDVSGASPVLTITRTSGSFTNTINFNSSASNFASIISNSGTGEQRYSIGPASGWGGFHTFYTDTTEKMRITSSGNVGIGTTSPTYKLEVVGGPDYQQLRVAHSSHVLASLESTVANRQVLVGYKSATREYSVGLQTNGDFSWYDNTASATRMRITPGGSVGIGTSSPISKLNVNTTDSANNVITVTNGTQELALGVNNGSGGSFLFENSNNALRLGTAGTERMRITNEGNVAIGTTAPIHKLSVNGKIGGDVYADSFVEFTATTETIVSADGNVVLGYAQNVVVDNEGSVGVGTIAPEACAAVEIKSITQGFLPPRMRTGERDSIGSPVAGLMIFNTDDEVVQVYTNGSGWRTLAFL